MLNCEFISDEHKENIQAFNCSDEISVAVFLKEHALGLHLINSAITRLFFDDNRNLIGYFTLYNEMVFMSEEKRRKHDLDHMPKDKHLPAVKMHYLGVDERYRKRGFGEYLLFEALYVIKQISNMSGCNFVTLESLNSSYGFYEKYEFQKLRQIDRDYTAMFYNLETLDI
jgi:ribosomal protein S18 acetylase RimI-like enzyme